MVGKQSGIFKEISLDTGWWYRMGHVAWRVLIYAVLIAGCLILLIPLAWMLSTAVKDLKYVFIFPPQWIPEEIHWDNFYTALTIFPFGLYFWNTFVICTISVIGSVLSSGIVAYAFARLDFPGRDILFLLVLATLMIPGHVTLVPRYIFFNWVGIVDSIIPLVLPAILGGSPVYIFLLRQFFMTLPVEMDEAALIDGCSKWGIFWRIIVPQSLPALGIVAIFSFLYNWNEFLEPLIYLHSPDKRTVALGLAAFRSSEGGVQPAWNLLMAASLAITVPPVLIFFVAQRYFIQGIVFSGVKG